MNNKGINGQGLAHFNNKINAKLSKKADLVNGKIPSEQLPNDEIVYIPFVINNGSFSLAEGVTYKTISDYYNAGIHIFATATIVNDSTYGTLGEIRIPLVRYCDSYEQPFFSFLLSNEIRTVEIMVNADGSIFSFIHTVQTLSNMVTSISEASRNDQYPSALAVHTAIQDAIADVGSGDGGGSAEQEIFYVPMTYEDGDVSLNDVSYEDILTAYTNDKRIIAVVDGLYGEASLPMTRLNNSVFIFNVTIGSNSIALNVYDDDTASINEMDLQRTSRLTKSISASSTDAQYPSAKAVYNFVQANAGGSGESVKEIEFITCDVDLSTMSVHNFSHTYQQLLDIISSTKYAVVKANTAIGNTYCPLSAQNIADGSIIFQLFVYGDFGTGKTLFFFNFAIFSNDTTYLKPYAVSITG